MKIVTTEILAIIGALTLFLIALWVARNELASNFEKMAKEEFGTPDAIAAIHALYARVETAQNDPALKIVEGNGPFSRVGTIPKSWLPIQFSECGDSRTNLLT